MNYNYGVRKKSVVSVILLTFITCGIYTFFWMYQTTKELAEYSGDNRLSPETSILLTILTCGVVSNLLVVSNRGYLYECATTSENASFE